MKPDQPFTQAKGVSVAEEINSERNPPPLERWNACRLPEAAAAILPCNGSQAWADAMASERPLLTPQALFAAADRIWKRLGAADWEQAFASHPRIGGTQARSATAKSLGWSAGEQSRAESDLELQAALQQGNQEYERKFGRTFLICATGKSAAEILGVLQRRMRNDEATEWLEAAEQQRRITQLRLRKWLGLAAPGCEDV